MTRTTAIALALAIMAPADANATAEGCAIVRKAPDGFLALRQAPTMRALMIVKLKPGWRLSVDTLECEVNGAVSICAGTIWTHVTGVSELDGGLAVPDNTQGWVASRYLKIFEC